MTKLFGRRSAQPHVLAHRRHCHDETACTSPTVSHSCSSGYDSMPETDEKRPLLRRLLDLLKKKEHRHSSSHNSHFKPIIGLYLVRPGDTLADIALRHEMHEMELRSLNKIRKPKHQKKKLAPGKQIKVYRRLRTSSVPTQCLRVPPSAITLHDLPVELQCECDDWNLCVCRQQQNHSNDDLLQATMDHDQPKQQQQQDVDEDNNSSCHYSCVDDQDLVDVPRSKSMNLFQKLFQRRSNKHNRQPYFSNDQDQLRSRASCLDRRASGTYYDHDEVINMHRSMSEMALRTNNRRKPEFKIVLPELIGGSYDDILSNPDHKKTLVAQIENCLPHAYRGYDWKLAFSCLQHGSNLYTLMHKLAHHNGSLILIETVGGEVFGAFNAVAWKKQPSYYGSGQSFVFSCVPKFEFFPWTRANSMFMMSNSTSIAMGGGGDGFAWCLDADLSRGTTNCSKTFNNKMFTPTCQFDVVHVEAWTFVSRR